MYKYETKFLMIELNRLYIDVERCPLCVKGEIKTDIRLLEDAIHYLMNGGQVAE
ncbi:MULTISPECIES: hypothetical protein [Sporosarcina]|uniref:Uncharacterized protein n=1 Tax=Sporosarcina contaminans TaxID=633403 RepID=A0ABW3U058_9BACL